MIEWYEAGNCAIVISMKTFLKWCPKYVFRCLIFTQNWFECSLHADQNGTNPKMVQISFLAKIPSKVYTKHSTLICIRSIKWKTHRTLLCKWDMKLGIVPLWSAWKDLSDDVLRVDSNVGHIFAKKHTQPKATIAMVFHDFESKFNLQQKCWSHMVQIPPSYLIPSPRYLAKYIQSTQKLT